jgi:hypothetical protein
MALAAKQFGSLAMFLVARPGLLTNRLGAGLSGVLAGDN